MLTQISDNYQRMLLLDDIDGSNDFVSIAINTNTMHMGDMQFCWAGFDSKKASFYFEVSNDGVNFCSMFKEIENSTVGNGCASYSVGQLTAGFVRARYTASNNSSGTLSCTLLLKRYRSNHP